MCETEKKRETDKRSNWGLAKKKKKNGRGSTFQEKRRKEGSKVGGEQRRQY